MEFRYRFHGHSKVDDSASETALSFAPDTLREPAFFTGKIAQHLPFREAISALHAVVVSDLRFQPRDRSEYLRWLEQHELGLLAQYVAEHRSASERIAALREELGVLRKQNAKVMRPYYRAQERYFRYLYTTDMDAWIVLDPVITVHPDRILFECFSQDESSYGCLSCSHEVFEQLGEMAYGTTNIDYSAALYEQFQKIRSYKSTELRIEPAGFAVETQNEDEYIEEKIDLPDSWVRGFLQVSSAMTLDATVFNLHPMDVHALCLMLRRRKESHGPRSIRFCLEPGKPVRMVFDPWNAEIVCRRSIFAGDTAAEIRIWGRRRLTMLERLIAHARRFTVHLLGSGMPSFVIADLGDMSFTLGLSGWTANDWSRLGNFDLMAPRAEVDEFTRERVFNALGETWSESASSLAKRLELDSAVVRGALGVYTQAGRVIYDLDAGVYRRRELSREPLPSGRLRFDNEREEKAARFVGARLVKDVQVDVGDGRLSLRGSVRDDTHSHAASLVVDADQRLVQASCDCHFYVHNRLHKGPCEHVLALRMQHARGERRALEQH